MSKWVSHSHLRGNDWAILRTDEGRYAHEQVERALLMDIRAELQALNRVLSCPNFVEIPQLLRLIRKNTTKPRRRRVKK